MKEYPDKKFSLPYTPDTREIPGKIAEKNAMSVVETKGTQTKTRLDLSNLLGSSPKPRLICLFAFSLRSRNSTTPDTAIETKMKN